MIYIYMITYTGSHSSVGLNNGLVKYFQELSMDPYQGFV